MTGLADDLLAHGQELCLAGDLGLKPFLHVLEPGDVLYLDPVLSHGDVGVHTHGLLLARNPDQPPELYDKVGKEVPGLCGGGEIGSGHYLH